MSHRFWRLQTGFKERTCGVSRTHLALTKTHFPASRFMTDWYLASDTSYLTFCISWSIFFFWIFLFIAKTCPSKVRPSASHSQCGITFSNHGFFGLFSTQNRHLLGGKGHRMMISFCKQMWGTWKKPLNSQSKNDQRHCFAIQSVQSSKSKSL